MPRPTVATKVLEFLAAERRVVVADWRFDVMYGRVARAHGFRPPDASQLRKLVADFLKAGDIAPIDGVSGVYLVTVPYASSFPTPDEVVLAEANPAASLGFFSAISFHGLTIESPSVLCAISPPGRSARLPLGTVPEDWPDIPDPRRRFPDAIGGREVHWTHVKANWDFGVEVGYVEGLPIYVTTLEKTLVDSLRFPEKSGGADVVIRAWREAADRIRLKRLVDVVETYGQTLLRQRVGFMCEQIGLESPAFEFWAKSAGRGGSAKLIASESFSPCHSPRWSLSVNVPLELLPNAEQVQGC